MLLLRLLTTALCATCVVLLATFQPIRVEVDSPPGMVRGRGPPVNVVDVAAGVAPSELAALVPLRPGEHVTAVNDRAPVSDLDAGSLIASLAPRPGGFVDVTVSSATTERRVLMLLH